MSTNEPFTSPDGIQPFPPKSGMSTGTKVLIILGILFVVLVLLCCGGLMLSGFFFSSYMAKAVSEDPQVIAERTQDMIQIDIPEVLEPAKSLDMNIPFSDEQLMVWVTYADQESQSTLVLASFGEMLAGQNQEQMKMQIEQSLRQQGLSGSEDLKNWKAEEREIQVRGEPVTFVFVRGEDANSGAQRIQVTGTFQGNSGSVMFMLFADAETLNEEAIVEMIESIR